MTEAWHLLDAPPVVISSDPTPVPFAQGLEAAWMPDAERIAARVAALVREDHLLGSSA
jgi:pyruvate/2-oxoglutarate/acetoin dehydrogenase E1 component